MKKTLVLIGTYTQPILFGTGEILNGHGDGVYVYEFEAGQLMLKSSAPTTNASFLVMDPAQRYLYATNELKEYKGTFGGSVSAFRYNPQDDTLTYLNTQGVHGADPCHIEVNGAATHLYCANFMSGSVTVLPIRADGSLGESCCFIQHEGQSVDPARQLGPHAHGVFFDSTGQRLFVPDLGMDMTLGYQVQKDGNLEADPALHIPAPIPGTGPRHMVFHPRAPFVYINTEMGSTLLSYRYDAVSGQTQHLQTLSTIPEDVDKASTSTSAIKLHPNGKWLYVSNRGHNSLATYRVDEETGMLTLVAIQPTGGDIPRDFEITPDGSYLIAAHQSSDSVMVFALDSDTGLLTEVSRIRVPTPICVRVYEF